MKVTLYLVLFLQMLFVLWIMLFIPLMQMRNRKASSGLLLSHINQREWPSGAKRNNIQRKCEKCGVTYTVEKSKSSLRLTWCSILCETNALGFHLQSLENGRYSRKSDLETVKPEVTSMKSDDDNLDDEEGGNHIPPVPPHKDDNLFGGLVPV